MSKGKLKREREVSSAREQFGCTFVEKEVHSSWFFPLFSPSSLMIRGN
jgi:hypothetical protein